MTDLSAWGVEHGWYDTLGGWHEPAPDTLERVAHALGARPGAPPGTGADSPVWVVGQGDLVRADGPWDLRFEDGGSVRGEGVLPPGLPLGYHDLTLLDPQRSIRLVVSPRRCHRWGGSRTWGWAAQLYALRSRGSWGMGDLGDLGHLARWSAGSGAGVLLVNPLHAPLPGLPQEPSPYFASSRLWCNPLYLCVEDVPGVAVISDVIAPLARSGRALLAERRIDRDAVWTTKVAALERLWAAFCDRGGDPSFERWRAAQGKLLERFAIFAALWERHRRPWVTWPIGHRHPDRPEVADFARTESQRVGFHAWLQWLADRQLEVAGAPVALVNDLAVGIDPDGCDAWSWQDCLALDMRIGAPPDEFSRDGQDWGLPPFDPWRLRTACFEPWVAALRASMRHAGGLRIDHVMGLFRLWWIPSGAMPSEGVYVRYPSPELLDVLALESTRAGAFVVGEDLGTVEEGVREELAQRDIATSKVLLFEESSPRDWPESSLGTISTHDLPTLAGLLSGSDLAAQLGMGRAVDPLTVAGMVARVRRQLRGVEGADDLGTSGPRNHDGPAASARPPGSMDPGVQPDGAASTGNDGRESAWRDERVGQDVLAAHRLLGEAASEVVVATLDDALGVEERTNYPGTVDQWPNWSLALPELLDDLVDEPRVQAVGSLLARLRPGPGRPRRPPRASTAPPR